MLSGPLFRIAQAKFARNRSLVSCPVTLRRYAGAMSDEPELPFYSRTSGRPKRLETDQPSPSGASG
jgi:hypothetical protein